MSAFLAWSQVELVFPTKTETSRTLKGRFTVEAADGDAVRVDERSGACREHILLGGAKIVSIGTDALVVDGYWFSGRIDGKAETWPVRITCTGPVARERWS